MKPFSRWGGGVDDSNLTLRTNFVAKNTMKTLVNLTSH